MKDKNIEVLLKNVTFEKVCCFLQSQEEDVVTHFMLNFSQEQKEKFQEEIKTPVSTKECNKATKQISRMMKILTEGLH